MSSGKTSVPLCRIKVFTPARGSILSDSEKADFRKTAMETLLAHLQVALCVDLEGDHDF